MPAARLMLVLTLGLAACDRAGTSAPLPKVEVTDQRHNGLVFLVATIRRTGPYLLRIKEVDAGQTVKGTSSTFTTSRALPFDARHVAPRTLIVSAEIGEGGPTGVYAVRL
jgi:hypothetical protein